MGLFSNNKNRAQLLLEAKELMDRENYIKSIPLLEKALSTSLNPDEQFPILVLLGVCSMHQKDYKSTVTYCEKALNLNHNFDESATKEAYYTLGVSYYYLAEYQKAIEPLTNYNSGSNKRMAIRLRGESYQKCNEFEKSISDLEEYFGNIENIELVEDNFRPIVALSNSYIQTNRFIDGISLILKAYEIKPDDMNIKMSLSTFVMEYLNVDDEEFNFDNLISKGKLFSKITYALSPDNSDSLGKSMQLAFIEQFENAKTRKPNLVVMDVLNIGSHVAVEMFKEWEINNQSINNIQKSYLTYEVSKVIHNFEFFKMDLDEIHRSIFNSSYFLSIAQ
ncbi:MAG: tetratricopeptide repeat protein [Bacteroidales bacterium]|nr:tetratricopeptide repeat protein [Bacteroidales bacterium]